MCISEFNISVVHFTAFIDCKVYISAWRVIFVIKLVTEIAILILGLRWGLILWLNRDDQDESCQSNDNVNDYKVTGVD